MEGPASGLEWHGRGSPKARGAFARVAWHIAGDVGRWVWWLRVPVLAPWALLGFTIAILLASPLLAVVFLLGYPKGERLPAFKKSFTATSRRNGLTWQAMRPPRTQLIRNLRLVLRRR